MPDGSFYFVENVRKLPTLFEKHVTNGDVDKALQLLATTIDDLEVFLQGRFHALISLAAQSEHLIRLEFHQASINLKTKKSNLIHQKCQTHWMIGFISRLFCMHVMKLFVFVQF